MAAKTETVSTGLVFPIYGDIKIVEGQVELLQLMIWSTISSGSTSQRDDRPGKAITNASEASLTAACEWRRGRQRAGLAEAVFMASPMEPVLKRAEPTVRL